MQPSPQQPLIVHHMAALDSSPFPPNSLEAIRLCLEADAPFIEIDVTALAVEDYLLVHDPVLDSETTGVGEVGATRADAAKALSIKHRGAATPYHPALLSEVAALFLEMGGRARLQIDYKNVLPMRDDEPLRRLLRLIEPLGERVLVSSGADWHLRRLRALAPWLDLGFDIGFYLDYRQEPGDSRQPPFRLGAYGYYDDHILAGRALQEPAAYLAERCELLLRAIPDVSTWYVSYRMLARSLDDGFDMTAWLHRAGVKMDAWTLDADKPAAVAELPRLKAAGVDQFTTNTPRALAALLKD
ncbi:MAG: glycerophosphodiester phosphodiesterase [Anaerolineae bacterium]|nr:glycerophosphodiester phosphodiesterase [Anaerolineae bacterium]